MCILMFKNLQEEINVLKVNLGHFFELCLFSHDLFCFVSFLIKDYYSSFYLVAKTSLSTSTKKSRAE